MPNQIKQTTSYLFAKVAIRHFQALSAHLYQHDPKRLLFTRLFKSF
jgi:hypothetical protein